MSATLATPRNPNAAKSMKCQTATVANSNTSIVERSAKALQLGLSANEMPGHGNLPSAERPSTDGLDTLDKGGIDSPIRGAILSGLQPNKLMLTTE